MSQRIIVVGGGVMGLATAWQLARRGERPIVLERFDRGHHEGASHGDTRNYNNAYGDDDYLDLLALAREGWDALGVVEGEPLLRRHGLVSHGAGASLGSIDGAAPGVLESIAAKLEGRGIPAALLDAGEAAARWSGMRFEGTVLHSPDAGVARAAAALRELERRTVAARGEVRWSTRVRAIAPDADGVDVVTDAGALRADVVVVTAGAWSASLLGGGTEDLGIHLPRLRVTEETPAHFAARVAGPWPSFNHFVAPGSQPSNIYGMPTPGEGVKVGFHGVGAEVDPDARPHLPTLQRELRAYVREWFPGLDPDSAVPISCTYTTTPTEAFVLDRVGRVVVGAGFSGHGFKFAPGVGATLAGLALDPSAVAAAPFRLSA